MAQPNFKKIFAGKPKLLDEWMKSDKIEMDNGLTIVDTDEWDDLLLCGTGLPTSCLTINSDVKAHFLLGYVLDPKYRMVAIKNKSGEIVARAMIRLMWDETSKKPVLFVEDTYRRVGIDDKAVREMQNLILKRAQALGVSVMVANDQIHPSSKLASYGNAAGVELVDAGPGETNGIYTLDYIREITPANTGIWLRLR